MKFCQLFLRLAAPDPSAGKSQRNVVKEDCKASDMEDVGARKIGLAEIIIIFIY
jgi:hypothetical protein